MTAAPAQPFDDACYLALKARDARFDGRFFTGVTSTGIYCRPVCRVRTPKRENCRFFPHAAQAELAGFRPCLRCRPELAPRNGLVGSHPAWSMQDASSILAHQAARLLDNPLSWGDSAPGVAALAQRLGISDRHLRRIFEAHFGVSPLRYLQTRRLLCAKQLLTDTPLPVAQVANVSGFASVRRFNTVFVGHYGLQPTQFRRDRAVASQGAPGGISVQLAYRPPYDVAAMLSFFQTRQLAGTEVVTLAPGQSGVARTLSVDIAGQRLCGWLSAGFDEAHHRVNLTMSESLMTALPQVMAAVRHLLDLDADPQAINAVLHDDFPHGDGLRLPGTLDGFELAVRAVLGQQISVAAARTLCNRLVARFGEPITTPISGLTRFFPGAQVLAQATGDDLGQLGIVKQRQNAIIALARAVADGQLTLHPGAPLAPTLSNLQALPGFGDWTVQYIAMRALGWPDAFPAGDVALHKALAVQHEAHLAKAALAAASAWQPWRSYAVMRAWARLSDAPPSAKPAFKASEYSH
ncbi:MAG: adenosine deaminase [Rhodoferax ferrireducens]|uniref:DNA-3-methyladenine glycosylase II n=1 Tax=Rhodoferax ferrireducens TaxID=192843 RepID=A0A1W9KWL7_9BURK|nr:MAG: adenosine deaminase [Rhodoferax ferrireducens]